MENSPKWHTVAPITGFKDRQYQLLTTDLYRIAVYKIDNQYIAFEDKCTHNPCPLSGGPIEGDEITCTMHGARFNLKTAQATAAPAYLPLKTFPVRESEGNIEVYSE